MIDWLLRLFFFCWWHSDDERGRYNLSGTLILMLIVLAAVGLVWFFIWLVGMMATYGRA